MALPILDGNQSATTLSTILTGGQHIPAHTVVSLGSQAVTDMRSAVSGSVVSISNFPSTQTIAGTVTATVRQGEDAIIHDPVSAYTSVRAQSHWFSDFDSELKTTSENNPLPISGTVTVGASSVTFNSFVGQRGDGSWQAISLQTGSNYVNANIPGSVTIGSLPAISGTVTVSNQQQLADALIDQTSFYAPLQVSIAGAGANVPISGTVTANNPSGAVTTRFGSVTTANTAQLTSAVTNTSRKYLLVQNIAASTVTIGIGFAPTTTQGIQLTAGAGLTFDAFCPTGGVWWLSSTTGSNFSILEG
jgi:hypothetical protein